ncbi:MAG: COG2426 family protein [Minisyncoccia bacterium]
MIPINELRGTIPLALSVYHLTIWEAFFYSAIGNIIPVFILLFLLPRITNVLMKKSRKIDKFFTWLFERTRKKFYKKYSLYGDLALTIFVAIPLPLTGAWTGAIAAFLFGIPYWRACGLIFLGVLIAGIIITGLSTSAISIFNSI